MRIRTDKKIIHFDSVSEVGRYCSETRPRHNAIGHDYAGEWTGYQSFDVACTKAVFGDDSTVKKAQALMNKFGEMVESKQMMDMPSVFGGYPVVPEALNSEPECMRLPEYVATEAAPLHILVDLSSVVTATHEQMQARGVAILALVMALVAVRPVTLQYMSTLDGGDKPHATPRVKRGWEAMGTNDYSLITMDVPTAPLDLATAAYALTNVAFARHCLYAIAAKQHGFSGFWARINGTISQSEAKWKQGLKDELGITDETLIIECPRARHISLENPVGWMVELWHQYAGQMDALNN